MALDKNGELDVDKTVDSMAADLFPKQEEEDEPPLEHPSDPKEEVPSEPEEKPAPIEEPPKEEKLPPEEKPAEEETPPIEPKKAPQSWSKEMVPEFTKLPPSVQDYVLKREDDYTKGISQYKQAADYGMAVNQVVHPYMAHINARGVDVPTALKYLLNADYKLTNGTPEEKAAFFSQLLSDYGVDSAHLGKPAEKSAEVKALEERLGKTEGTLTEFQTRQLEERRAQVAKSVDAFAADPKNIYFAELSDDIVKFINAGYTLEDAYEKAVWANASTRAKEQVRLSKEKDEAAQKAATEAAAKAKKASRSNVKETPSSRSAPTGLIGSIDDTLRSTFRNIQDRS